LAAATVLLSCGAWLDLLWELSPACRIVTLGAAGISGIVALGTLAAITLRATADAAVARRLDQAGDAGGEILTGWELAQQRYEAGGVETPRLSAGLAMLAAQAAAAAARQVPLAKAVPVRPLDHSLAVLTALWAILAILAVCLPGLVQTQGSRLLRPFDDIPPFSLTRFQIAPGDVKVLYGSELDVRATVVGEPVEQLELVLATAHGQEPPLPMFPEGNGVWRAVLAKVIEPADYFVRAYRARSPKYRIGVISVPQIEGVRLRIVPPEYAHLATYEGPVPKEGISGLRGTKVQVFLRSNRPLRGGTIAVWRTRAADSPAGQPPAPQPQHVPTVEKTRTPKDKPTTFPMKPIDPNSPEVAGEFSIGSDGKFECRVVDQSGQASQQAFSGNLVMLPDRRPLIRISQPERMSLATPTAKLPVLLSAEDDCGISRLQLLHSVNDSRPVAADLPLPSLPPRRWDQRHDLPLARYGLQPGDVIKLFGRVEDNDPAGAKRAESAVATVRIVSQEEFDRLIGARLGIQAVFSKYDAARRRIEGLVKDVDELRDKLNKLPPGEKLSEEARRGLERLQQPMQQEGEDLRKLSEFSLPYDLDKNLTPQLDQLAQMAAGMAEELQKLQAGQDLSNGAVANNLAKMAERLASGREQYRESAVKPLEYFEAVRPLIEDQSRFVTLFLRQQDMAKRLAAMKGRNGEEDPVPTPRVRGLEEEQRQIRQSLGKFLDDLQEHVEKLPESPQLADLRQTTQAFARDVRGSGASEAMAAAETALAELAPTRGQQKAQEAADILAKFIHRGRDVGKGAERSLAFHPSLSKSLGNTISQMTAKTGMKNSGGMAAGSSTFGLYGGLPELSTGSGGPSDGRVKHAGGGSGLAAKSAGKNPDAATPGEVLAPGAATGSSEGAVPVRYRRQVGQYFQRVAEETGESDH